MAELAFLKLWLVISVVAICPLTLVSLIVNWQLWQRYQLLCRELELAEHQRLVPYWPPTLETHHEPPKPDTPTVEELPVLILPGSKTRQ